MSHDGGHAGGGGHHVGGHHSSDGGYIPAGRGRRPGPGRLLFALLFGVAVVVVVALVAH